MILLTVGAPMGVHYYIRFIYLLESFIINMWWLLRRNYGKKCIGHMSGGWCVSGRCTGAVRVVFSYTVSHIHQLLLLLLHLLSHLLSHFITPPVLLFIYYFHAPSCHPFLPYRLSFCFLKCYKASYSSPHGFVRSLSFLVSTISLHGPSSCFLPSLVHVC